MLPFLKSTGNPTKKYTIAFRGINYGEATQDGEFSETYNISSDKFPYISPRSHRRIARVGFAPTTMFAKDEKLLIIDRDAYGYYVAYTNKIVGRITEGKKHIASLGRYILIFPDKKYYDIENDVYGDMEATYEAQGLVFTDSTITTNGDDFPFKEGDAIAITGCSKSENNITIIVRKVEGKTLTFYENSFVESTEDDTVTLKREVPDLDFVCESKNRLFGTSGNTIYVSKLSDPFNFQVFDGLTSDSYYIDVGSDGEFTGIAPYDTHICFFKENIVHKLYGNKPSNFQIADAKIFGVQKGSERSLHLVNETLFYKGVNGVYAYSGGIPHLISEALGNKRFTDAVGCSDGEKYYISMKDGEKFGFYVYDIKTGVWLKEDNLEVVDMAFIDNKVWYLDAEEDKSATATYGDLYFINKEGDKKDIEWSATFCPFNETINEKKIYSKFHLRLDLAEGSWIAIDVKTDDNPWKQSFITHSLRAKTISVPIMPQRADEIQIRIRGKGDFTIKSLVREYRTGSDAR